ncbi:hypothetical protein S141_13 [Shewanella sp. phage 1/41]|uniref:hypothetical protein n=1 Tax=Shewanella sp. phage 1/41 TaxID=1458861 RepID=UPI0004F7F0E3|nr:hypothetical protein S141_13 [Shewanella sp. phage 1/41]AHK11659.1 hypothetical protein S141_13 [Shewanella sp. phage 1/41]
MLITSINLNSDIITGSKQMKPSEMIIGERYNFRNQNERLKYIGKNFSGNGFWHQFEKVGEQGVWCELLDSDLSMIEETK